MHFSPFDYEQLWTPQQFIKVEIILKYLVVFRLGWSRAWGWGAVKEKARNAPFMLQTSQPCSPSRVSSQGMKSGKGRQISGPVGALIKLRGSHSRIHMVSETMPSSSHFRLHFCFEGQRVDFTHFSSHHCSEAATSVIHRVSVPLEQEHRVWEPRPGRCQAVPHLLPVCTLSELTVHLPKAWSYSWH